LPPYEQLFGPAAVITTDDVVTVRVGRHAVVFASADDFAAMHPELDDDPPPMPGIAALTLTVRDVEATADYLTRWHVAHETAGDGSLLVPAEEANGVAVVFIAAR
jgi:hypothetical protein